MKSLQSLIDLFRVTIGEMDALERFIGCYREKPYETIHGMRLKVIQDD